MFSAEATRSAGTRYERLFATRKGGGLKKVKYIVLTLREAAAVRSNA
jgi:hypothetical protein